MRVKRGKINEILIKIILKNGQGSRYFGICLEGFTEENLRILGRFLIRYSIGGL